MYGTYDNGNGKQPLCSPTSILIVFKQTRNWQKHGNKTCKLIPHRLNYYNKLTKKEVVRIWVELETVERSRVALNF